jgi:hypothetical protein
MEVLSIYEDRGEIRFRFWYRPSGDEPSFFDGVVTMFGDVIWLFGHTAEGRDRLRILNFKYTRQQSRRYQRYHWGLMISDLSASHEPAACRIFLVRTERLLNLSHKTIAKTKLVDFLTIEEAQEKSGIVDIERLVANHNTSQSLPGGILPLVEGERLLTDLVLQVGQATIDTLSAGADV